MHMTLRFILLFLLAAMPLAAQTTWSVAPDGDDAAPGTIEAPFLTVHRAVQAAAPGDIIEMRSGHYLYEQRIRIGKNDLTLRSAPGEWAIIETPSDFGTSIFSTIYYDPHVVGGRLERLEIIGGWYYGVYIGSNWVDGSGQATSHITIADCYIHHTGRDAIKVSSAAHDITIERCRISHTGVGPGNVAVQNAEGIDIVNGDRIIVRGCYVHDISTTGMYAKGGSRDCVFEGNLIVNVGTNGIASGLTTDSEYADVEANGYETINHIIRNNVIINTGLNQIPLAVGKGHNGIMLRSTLGARVYNNTVINAAHGRDAAEAFPLAIYNETPSVNNRDLMIVNNLFYQQAGHGSTINRAARQMVLLAVTVEPPFVIDHNLYFHEEGPVVFNAYVPHLGGAGGYDDYWKLLGFDLNGVIDQDPRLVEMVPESDLLDAHLLADSPARGAGMGTAGLVPLDYDGDIRPPLPDIGADQYAPTTALDMPPPAETPGTGWDTLPPPPPQFAGVVVTPAEAFAFADGGTVTFHAQAVDQYGAPFDPELATVWDLAVGAFGSIDSTGTFTAAGVGGPFQVSATIGFHSGTATVTVRAQAVLTTLLIAPESASRFAGESATFSADVRDQYGDPIAVEVSWSLDEPEAGEVDTVTGEVTAGATPGSYVVRAQAGELEATAAFTVLAARVATNLGLTPAGGRFRTGTVQQLTASLTDQYGDPWPATLEWAVIDGDAMIGASGELQLGQTEGWVSVRLEGAGLQAEGSYEVLEFLLPDQVLAVSPAPGATQVPVQTALAIQLAATCHFDFTDNRFVRLYRVGQVEPVWTFDPPLGYPGSGTNTVSFELPELEPGVTYYVLTDGTWARLNAFPWRPDPFDDPELWSFTTAHTPASHYAAWRHLHFSDGLISDALQLPEADADGDGVPNLIEYGLGLDPRAPQGPGVALVPVTVSGELRLALEFPVVRDAPGLQVMVDHAAAPGDWVEGGRIGPGDAVDLGAELNLVEVWDSGPQRWYRIVLAPGTHPGNGVFMRLRVRQE